MKTRHQIRNMKNQIGALFLGLAFALTATGTSHAMSELMSLSQQAVWPTSPLPDGSLVYSITTVARGGAGLLEVTLSADGMPPGVTVTFSPPVMRFTGNQVSSQTALMVVTCPGPIPLDSYPFSITGTALRETISTTNVVQCSPDIVSTRIPTLYLNAQTNGLMRIRGLGATGKTYQIEGATSLGTPDWTSLGTSTADGNGRFTFFNNQIAGDAVRFYRAVLSPP
jgi:hypothetical protein